MKPQKEIGNMRLIIHDWGGYLFSRELAETLSARGHDVLYIYFPPMGFAGSYDAKADSRLTILPLAIDEPYRKDRFFRRALQDREYGRRLAREISAFRPDAVISGNSPLDVQRAALLAARRANASFLFWLQDIISAAMSDILPRRIPVIGHAAAAYYRSIERRLLKKSDSVICIADAFREIVMKCGVATEQCHVIENWAPLPASPRPPKDNSWSRAHGLHDKPVILYAGRLGLKQNPDLFYRLACAAQSDAHVVVVAGGPGAEQLTARVASEPLSNLHVFPFQPSERLPEVLATADILLAILEPSATAYSVPSKILTYLTAGRPIIAAMAETNPAVRTIKRAGAGLSVPPTDDAALWSACQKLLQDETMRRECGKGGLAYAEENFDAARIADRFTAAILASRK